MRFAQWVFRIAGLYGLLVLVPLYAMEARIGQDHPPAITHPEYYYGFVGVGVAWQIAFLVIALDPVRYRLMMLPAIVEKATFAAAVGLLWWSREVPPPIGLGAAIDCLLMVLFIASWITTRPRCSSEGCDR